MTLQERFSNLLTEFDISAEYLASYWQTIHEQYSEDGRHYHNLTHLEDVFALFDHYADKFNNPTPVMLAIFYHDAIYKTTPLKISSNEKASAKLAQKHLKAAGVDDNIIHRVVELIHMTETHDTPADDADAQLFMDLDMSILAAPQERYLEYTKQIQQEYKHIPAKMFKSGRLKFIDEALARPRIFLSDTFFTQHEEQARKNLQAEKQILQASVQKKSDFKP